MDRHDELIRGLYEGVVPEWLPEASRFFYQRESLRRRCTLGQALAADFRRTIYAAQCLFSADFSQQVYRTWPSLVGVASNVTTGLYLALHEALAAVDGAEAVRELLDFEALALTDLRCSVRAERVQPPAAAQEHLAAETEVYRFRFAVPAYHARMMLYAGSLAPASFVREYEAVERTTFVARTPLAGGWQVEDVTSLFEDDGEES